MSAALIRQIRAQRRISVAVGKFTFTVSRPTDVEALQLQKNGGAYSEIAQKFVVDWSGVSEDDIVGGGNVDPIPFDAALWNEWASDRPDFWEPISTAVLNAYIEHTKKLESIKGN